MSTKKAKIHVKRIEGKITIKTSISDVINNTKNKKCFLRIRHESDGAYSFQDLIRKYKEAHKKNDASIENEMKKNNC